MSICLETVYDFIMTTRLLDNVYLDLYQDSDHIDVLGYKIYPATLNHMSARYYTKHQQNAFVEFNGAQRSSIIFAGGFAGSIANPQNEEVY